MLKRNTSTRVLTNYEKTRILSERSSQISDGAQPLITNVDRFTSAYDIAVEELKQKRIPFIICRPIGNRKEYFKVSIEEIEKCIEENFEGEFELIKNYEAKEFRETQAILNTQSEKEKLKNEFPEKLF